jgi:hypothetical protein
MARCSNVHLALRIGEAIARGLDPEHIRALTITPEARDVLKMTKGYVHT